jgi:hypothetical protein
MDEYNDMTLTMVVPYLCVVVTATCCNATYYDNPGIRGNYRRQTKVETHGQGSKSPTPSDWRIPEETTISAILIFYQSSNRDDGYCRTGRNPDSPLVGSSLPSDFWPKSADFRRHPECPCPACSSFSDLAKPPSLRRI